MKYYEVDFDIQVPADMLPDARDVLSAIAGEVGFETFEETPDGLRGYVQQSLFCRSALDGMLAVFPFPAATVIYKVREAEDRDWNEQWEQEGFEPIMVKPIAPGCPTTSGAPSESRTLIIHDGRHVSSLVGDAESLLPIEIDTRLAFGTGNHETTRMVCSQLLSLPLDGCRVLDCGTGTGILAIVALKLGAREAVGYDIDEWSVDNARRNAVINRVDDRFRSLQGDASILGGSHEPEEQGEAQPFCGDSAVNGPFDVILANINRNILLNDLPAFLRVAAPGATVVLSGFYQADIPMLADRAATLGLTVIRQQTDGDWACLVLASPDRQCD